MTLTSTGMGLRRYEQEYRVDPDKMVKCDISEVVSRLISSFRETGVVEERPGFFLGRHQFVTKPLRHKEAPRELSIVFCRKSQDFLVKLSVIATSWHNRSGATYFLK